mgnify:CR=1 FL=1
MSNYTQLGGPEYDCVIETATRLGQPFAWIGPEHPEYGRWLVELCRSAGATRLAEFGTQCGGSGIPLARYCKEVGGSLDVHDVGEEKGSDTLTIFMETARSLGLADVVRHHRGRAQDCHVGPVDFVHIDHEKSDYRRCFESVLPMLSDGGIVVFHDADGHAEEFVAQIAQDYDLEFNHEVDGGAAMYRHSLDSSGLTFPLRGVAAQVMTHKEGPFLGAVLEMLVGKVERVYVMEERRPMFDNDAGTNWRTSFVVEEFLSAHPEARDAVFYAETDTGERGPAQEARRRTEALEMAQRSGFRWMWIVDADELYTDAEARALWEWFLPRAEKGARAAKASWYTYWKTMRTRIEPVERFRPTIIARTDSKALLARDMDVSAGALEVPPEVCMVRHYSWVRTPAETLRKIKSWGHAHQVVEGWFEKVYVGGQETDLHPTEPAAYERAVPCDLPQPEVLAAHPWNGLDRVTDADAIPSKLNVKAVVLHHNTPETADALFEKLSDAFDVELVDSGSSPDKTPVNMTVSLPNVYWEGVWEEAMRRWGHYDVLWVIGGDVSLCAEAAEYRDAIERAYPFGCWSPAVNGRAHPFMQASEGDGTLARVVNVEGMAMAVSGELARAVGRRFEVSTKVGFGQDFWLCAKARGEGMPNYVDGTVEVFHPHPIGYDEGDAHSRMDVAFGARFGPDYRRTLFSYREDFQGNLFKETQDMGDKKLTIAGVDNGWGVKEFTRITADFPECRLLIMRKGVSDFSSETPAEVVDYDPDMKEVLKADIALFPRVGAANREEFARVFSAGIPVVANVNHNNNLIEHEVDGFVYGNESWAKGWLRKLVNEEGLRLRIGGRAAQKAEALRQEHEARDGADKPAEAATPAPRAKGSRDCVVTVITPTFRRDPRVVSRCLDCVRLQTLADVEQLVCSDGAPEPQIASLVGGLGDSRITYHHTTVKKAGDFGNVVRSEMLAKASGEFVLFMDDDNLILPHYLERMVGAIRESGKDFAVCRVVHFGPLRPEATGHPPQVLTGIPVKLHHVDPLQVVVRTEAMRQVGWDTEKGYLADGHTLQALGEKFEHVEVPEVLGFHM